MATQYPLQPAEYLVLITDRNLQVVGDPIMNWDTLDVSLRFNEASSGLFTVPGHAWIRHQLVPGNRVVVRRNGQVLIAGPLEGWQLERSDDGENSGVGKLRVNFADDMAWIAGRLTYPNPALVPSLQVTDNWTFSGNAELALHALVNASAGPGALTARQVPQLVMGATAGVGTTIDVKALLMEPVTDVLRRAALAGGGLGFKTQQVGNQIQFVAYQPTDVSGNVRFGFNWGGLKYLSYEVQMPTATTAIVGGQGEGADRFTLERNNLGAEGSWGRIEKHIARPGNNPLAELEADGDQALVEEGETARLAASVADTTNMRFGVDYHLGSRVSVESWPGEAIADVVQTVHLQAWPTAGELISATVGSQAARNDSEFIKRLRKIDLRVGQLERSVQSV